VSEVHAERISSRRGRAVVVRGNDIDTDQIIPARYMTSIRFAGLEEFVFRDVRFNADGMPKGHPFDDRRFRGAEVLVVNQNFGCGSSREHAPQALQRWGIRGIVAESAAEIFFANCSALGLPVLTASAADVAALQAALAADPALEIELDLGALEVRWAGRRAAAGLPEAARRSLRDGSWDALGGLLAAEPQIRAAAARLPYIAGF
jgi:3-isopropylmalate/(R)-2-methylmalate dehydratase small subunit